MGSTAVSTGGDLNPLRYITFANGMLYGLEYLTVTDSIMNFQAEVCHIYFTQSVVYTESAEIASTPPPGFSELPTCPICLG